MPQLGASAITRPASTRWVEIHGFGGESGAGEALGFRMRLVPPLLGQRNRVAIDPEPGKGRRVALKLGPRAFFEGTVVMEVRPIVKAPEEAT